MTDPSSNVPQHLLRHIHLICNKQFPVMHRPNLATVLQHLLDAPRIVRDEASMTWKTLIEPQPDGKVMLVWQSRPKTDFATDGFVWLDVERSSVHREGRYTLEVFTHNNGYRQTAEQVTLHARRRYHLVPSQPPTPGLQVDPSLWIVQYYQTEPQNQIPISSLAIPDPMKQLMNEQRIMQSQRQLQLQHNEFMLHDRNKWPSIHGPGTVAPSYSQQPMMYPNNVMAQMNRGHLSGYSNQYQGAVGQGSMGPSPAKRPRHASINQAPPSTTAIGHHLDAREALMNDEDTPDYMDTLMPREISALRYKQHHEWLEEVLSSPYDTYQILPEELGLGRKGELESLTRDFFYAHTSRNTARELQEPRTPTDKDVEQGNPVVDEDPPPRVGRLPEGKADEFRQLAAERMENLQREMQAMRAEHSQQMESLKGVNSWKAAEHQLRASTASAINGKLTPAEVAEIDDLMTAAEQKAGKRLKILDRVQCIQRGESQERASETGASVTSETRNPTPRDDGNDLNSPKSSEASVEKQSAQLPPPPTSSLIETSEGAMSGSVEKQIPVLNEAAPSAGENGVDDWIMVDQDAGANDSLNETSAFDSFTNDSAMQIDEKPGVNAEDVPAPTELELGDTEFDAGLDLADFNTTGPEMSSYSNNVENAGGDGEPGSVATLGDTDSLQRSPQFKNNEPLNQ